MNWRISCRRVVDVGLWFNLSLLAATGLLIWLRLPPGRAGGRGLEVLGWSRHDWGDLHVYIAASFVTLLVFHLLLNFTWMRRTAAYGRLWLLLGVIGAGLGVVALLLLLPVTGRG